MYQTSPATGSLGRQSPSWLFVSVVLVAGGLFFYVVLPYLARNEDVSAFVHKASSAADSVVARVSSLTASQPPSQVAPKASPAAPVAPRTAASSARAKRTASALKRSTAGVPPVLDGGTNANGSAVSAAMARLKTALTELSSRGAATETAHSSVSPAIAPAALYSSADEGIVPPVPIGAQLPKDSPPAGLASVGRVEFVVLSDGRVSSVKLLNRLNNVHELMFLSVIKAWRFQPALRDGKPVSYRKTITIALP